MSYKTTSYTMPWSSSGGQALPISNSIPRATSFFGCIFLKQVLRCCCVLVSGPPVSCATQKERPCRVHKNAHAINPWHISPNSEWCPRALLPLLSFDFHFSIRAQLTWVCQPRAHKNATLYTQGVMCICYAQMMSAMLMFVLIGQKYPVKYRLTLVNPCLRQIFIYARALYLELAVTIFLCAQRTSGLRLHRRRTGFFVYNIWKLALALSLRPLEICSSRAISLITCDSRYEDTQ